MLVFNVTFTERHLFAYSHHFLFQEHSALSQHRTNKQVKWYFDFSQKQISTH